MQLVGPGAADTREVPPRWSNPEDGGIRATMSRRSWDRRRPRCKAPPATVPLAGRVQNVRALPGSNSIHLSGASSSCVLVFPRVQKGISDSPPSIPSNLHNSRPRAQNLRFAARYQPKVSAGNALGGVQIAQVVTQSSLGGRAGATCINIGQCNEARPRARNSSKDFERPPVDGRGAAA